MRDLLLPVKMMYLRNYNQDMITKKCFSWPLLLEMPPYCCVHFSAPGPMYHACILGSENYLFFKGFDVPVSIQTNTARG